MYRIWLSYAVKDIFGMKVFKTGEDLFRERFGHFFFELAMLDQAAANGATMDVLQEAAQYH